MYLTILGSCRQHSLNNIYNCTGIQEKLTYPHYTKEILQTIKYLKYKNLDDSEVLFTFRTPILEKKISDYNELKKDFDKTDIFVLEIASKMYYKYNDIYLHHIATEEQYNISIKNKIEIGKLTKEEIEQDILNIKKELNKPLIIISHLVTKNEGDRYELKCWLEEICRKSNILFLDPIKELKKEYINIDSYFLKEKSLNHYNEMGFEKIKKIYDIFINKLIMEEIYSLIKNRSNYIIDIGASSCSPNDPLYKFIINNEFKGLCIEGNKDNIVKLKEGIANTFQIYDNYIYPDNIIEVFEQFNIPIEIDILKIDIDGFDLEIIRTILTKYKPKIIIAEYNEKIPPPILFETKFKKDYVWDYSHCFGFSISSGEKVMDEYNYSIVKILELNNIICVQNEICHQLNISKKNINDI